MRSLDELTRDRLVMTTDSSTPRPRRTLHTEAIAIYREEIAELKEQLRVLKRQVLAHDKKEAASARAVRSATEDVDSLTEAVSILADSISNKNREGRRVRAEARRLLEARGVTPPSTLGSSRNRPKSKSRRQESLDE